MFAYIQNVSSLFVTDVWGQPIPNSRVKQSNKRISWKMSVYKSQEYDLLKLDNISSKKLYAVKLNIILMAVTARLKKFNIILKSFVSGNLLSWKL